MEKRTLKIVLPIALFSLILVTTVYGFNAPSGQSGVGGGAILTDSVGNITFGTSTPGSASRLNVYASSTSASDYGAKVMQPNGTLLFGVRNDGGIVFKDSTVQTTAAVGGATTTPAGYVTPGYFNSIAAGAGSAYEFPGSISVGTSTVLTSAAIYASPSASQNYGIYANAPVIAGPGGYGVYASAGGNNEAIYAISGGSNAIHAETTSGAAVYASSTNASGVIAAGGTWGIYSLRGQNYFANNVGIGTTVPTSTLTVAGTIQSTTGGFKFPDGTTQSTAAVAGSYSPWNASGSNVILATSTNKVGVGTTTPATRLQVYDTTAITTFTGLQNQGLTITGGTQAGSQYSLIGFRASDYLPANNFAQIGAKFTGSGSYLQFGTSNNYGNGITNTALTIDPSGKVGVGITPAAGLHISGSSEVSPIEGYDTTNANVGNVLRIASDQNRVFDGGVLLFGASGGPTGFIKTGAVNGTISRLYIGTNLGVNPIVPNITIKEDGSTTFSGTTYASDIYAIRNGATNTGVIYLGNSGTRYLYYDGTNYVLGGGVSRLTALATPVASSDAATKGYVDAAITSSKSQSQKFTGSGSFTVPANVTLVWVTVWGGGGGAGGAAGSTAGGGGGGGGEIIYHYPLTVSGGQVLTVTIGGGGAGGTNAANGTAGTASSVGTLTAAGGGAGTYGVGSSGGGGGNGGGAAGGVGGNYFGTQPGGNGTSYEYDIGGGGGGSGSYNGATGGAGGLVALYRGGNGGYQAGGGGAGFGGAGGNGSSGAGGSAAANSGAGGGGAGTSGNAGGSGGSGGAIIEWVSP